jgi:PAS domain S-box-containing protein
VNSKAPRKGPSVSSLSSSDRIFAAGEMAELIRAFDWSATPVGPIDQWPGTLLVTVNTMLATRHPMFLWWGDDLIQFYNDAYRPSLGRDKHPKAVGQPGRECWPEIWPVIGPQIDAVMSRGESTWHEDQLIPIYRDGKLEDVWWTYSYSPVRDPEGTIRGTLVTCSETTGRVLAEEQLRVSQRQYKALFDLASDAVFIANVSGTISEANVAACKLLGCDREQLLGRNYAEVVVEGEVPRLWKARDELLKGGISVEEWQLITKQGSIISAEVSAAILPDGRWQAFVRDISDRKRMEQERTRLVAELQRERSLFSTILENVPLGIVFAEAPSGKIAFGNKQTEAIFRHPLHPSETIEQYREWEAYHADGRRAEGHEYPLSRALRSGKVEHGEYRYRRGDGTPIWIRVIGAPVRDSNGAITGALVVFSDVDEQKRAEAARDALSEQFQQVLDVTTDAVVSLDRKWRMTYLNWRAREILAPRGDVLGTILWESFPATVYEGSPYVENYYRAMNEGVAGSFEAYYPEPLNIWLYVMARPSKDGIIVFFRDVTEQKRAAAVLIQSEKLAAVGRLASSIAHEINNPLEAVTNLLYLSAQTATTPEVKKYLAMAQQELARVSNIATQTLRFHRQSTNPRETSLQDLLENVLTLFQGRIGGAGIAIDRQYRTDRKIVAFGGDLRQVFANLVSNALDASPRGGKIVIRLRDGCDWSGNHGVRVTIADSGIGMSSETRRRIFEPFFTTKSSTGTGLGLWVSSEILRNHHAYVRIRSSQSADRHGTIFSIFFPMYAAET